MPPFEPTSIGFSGGGNLQFEQPDQFARVVISQRDSGTVDIGDIQGIFGLTLMSFCDVLKFDRMMCSDIQVSDVRFSISNIQHNQRQDHC